MLRSHRLQKSSVKRFLSLSQIPTLGAVPFLGSSLAFWRAHKTRDGREFFPADSFLDAYPIWYEKHGCIYTMGLPGWGDGIKHIFVVCCDPREYVKVIHNEGRNPSGMFSNDWPVITALKKINSPVQGLWSHGEDWRRIRMASQKGLVTPESVKGYIPGISKTAALASENFAQWGDKIQIFNNHIAFDMIFTSLFGRLLDSLSEGSDEKTAHYTKTSMELMNEVLLMFLSPYEGLMNTLGITTSRVKKYTEGVKAHVAMSGVLVDEFLARRECGELDEYELGSYISVNLSRQEKVEDGLTFFEFKNLMPFLLDAGVFTTSSVLNWIQLFLALHPEVQTKVRQEVLKCVTVGGNSQDLVEFVTRPKRYFPYLNMVIREVHRLRPPMAFTVIKRIDKEIELGGYAIPAGTMCQLEGYSIQNDPKFVENPEKFLPERWSPDAIEARKTHPAEVIDHPLIRGPFSAGARMCPGHRVAQLEVITMIATLVRQWEFTLAPGQGISDYRDIKHFNGFNLQPKQMPKFSIKKLSG